MACQDLKHTGQGSGRVYNMNLIRRGDLVEAAVVLFNLRFYLLTT